MPEEDMRSVETVIKHVQQDIVSIMRTLVSNVRATNGAAKEELRTMNERAYVLQRSLDEVMGAMRKQKEKVLVKERETQAG